MATQTPSAKRQTSSISVPAAKAQCKIHFKATIADKAQLIGPGTIVIGEDTLLHPHAKIIAEHGDVTIGKGCIIAEKAVVGVAQSGPHNHVSIGEGVSIESGAVIEGSGIGNYSTIEVNARVRRGAVIGQWCKIAPLCEVGEDEVLADFTVVYGTGQRRVNTVLREQRQIRDIKIKGREKELRLLRTLIPDASIKWSGT